MGLVSACVVLRRLRDEDGEVNQTCVACVSGSLSFVGWWGWAGDGDGDEMGWSCHASSLQRGIGESDLRDSGGV